MTYEPNAPSDLPRLLQQLEAHRSDLKSYSELINSVVYNRFGQTLHQVIWSAEKHRLKMSASEGPLTQIVIANATELSEFELSRRLDCLQYLGSQYEAIGGFDADSTFGDSSRQNGSR